MILRLILAITLLATPCFAGLQDQLAAVAAKKGGGSYTPNCDGVTMLIGASGDDETLSSTSGINGSYWYAFRKTSEANGTVGCVKLFIYDDGSETSSNVGIAIYADDDGVGAESDPTGSAVAAGAYAAYNWTTTGDAALHEFILDSSVLVLSGTVYWIGLHVSTGTTVQFRETATGAQEKRYQSGADYESPPTGSWSAPSSKRVAISAW